MSEICRSKFTTVGTCLLEDDDVEASDETWHLYLEAQFDYEFPARLFRVSPHLRSIWPYQATRAVAMQLIVH